MGLETARSEKIKLRYGELLSEFWFNRWSVVISIFRSDSKRDLGLVVKQMPQNDVGNFLAGNEIFLGK